MSLASEGGQKKDPAGTQIGKNGPRTVAKSWVHTLWKRTLSRPIVQVTKGFSVQEGELIQVGGLGQPRSSEWARQIPGIQHLINHYCRFPSLGKDMKSLFAFDKRIKRI